VLPVSAKSRDSLEEATHRMVAFLESHPEVDLADVAYTLQARRTHFSFRRAVVAETREEAISALRAGATPAEVTRAPQVAFVFPGQGTQYVGMGRALYDVEPVFRRASDVCAEVLKPILGQDLREIVFARGGDRELTEARIRQTIFTQPSLFMVCYALSSMWRAFGVEPAVLAGHSVGELVAACIAGVFSLEDAAALVAQRGRLMQSLPSGAMLGVRAAASDIERRIHGGVALAASNGPSLSVVSGPEDEVARLREELEREGIATKPLQTSHAFHSSMMDPVVEPFAELVRRAKPSTPRIPIVSTATGSFLTDEQATDPMYWAEHLRVPVRFMEAIRTLWSEPTRLILEVGPRSTSALLARQVAVDSNRQIAVSSLEDAPGTELRAVGRALSTLWLARVPVDWVAYQALGRRRVVSLPSYPFARERHFLEAGESATAPGCEAPLGTPNHVASEMPHSAPALEVLLESQLGLMEAQLRALSSLAGSKPEPNGDRVKG